ncbi:ribonuclease 2 [Euphorbia peplus]|nr:ribonuclease 2 [Euphorbia peplus]
MLCSLCLLIAESGNAPSQWEKHGTCSSPVFEDEYNYFLSTLNVYFKYNVTKVLIEEGYVPSNSEKYPLGGVISAIENAFHATPSLACSRGEVEELYICFDKNFKPRNCATQSTTQDLYSKSCPKYISLPEYASLGLDSSETITSGIAGSEAL